VGRKISNDQEITQMVDIKRRRSKFGWDYLKVGLN